MIVSSVDRDSLAEWTLAGAFAAPMRPSASLRADEESALRSCQEHRRGHAPGLAGCFGICSDVTKIGEESRRQRPDRRSSPGRSPLRAGDASSEGTATKIAC